MRLYGKAPAAGWFTWYGARVRHYFKLRGKTTACGAGKGRRYLLHEAEGAPRCSRCEALQAKEGAA